MVNYFIEILGKDDTVKRTDYKFSTMESAARFASYFSVPGNELCHLKSPAQFVDEVITAYTGLMTGEWTVVPGMGNAMTLRIVAVPESRS